MATIKEMQAQVEVLTAQLADANARLATARTEFVAMRTKLEDVEKRATKFHADFVEATKWAGFWKQKYQRLVAVRNNANSSEGLSFAERAAAARAKAVETGKSVTV